MAQGQVSSGDLESMWEWKTSPPNSPRGSLHGGKAFVQRSGPGVLFSSGSGPDLTSFNEKPRVEMLEEAAAAQMASMQRKGSVSSQLWGWFTSTPPQSPAPSRNPSVHGGQAYPVQPNK